MSVATMTKMASRKPVVDSSNDKASLDARLGTIAAYIPSEVLAAYTTALGVTATVSEAGWVRWALYIGTLVVMVLYIALRYGNARKQQARTAGANGSGQGAGAQVWVAILAGVAFTAYVMALPGSPFGDGGVNIAGGLLVVVLALLLPQVGKLVGVTPENR